MLSLCLSRACLGKIIIFMYEWLKKTVFSPALSSSIASPTKLPTKRECSTEHHTISLAQERVLSGGVTRDTRTVIELIEQATRHTQTQFLKGAERGRAAVRTGLEILPVPRVVDQVAVDVV